MYDLLVLFLEFNILCVMAYKKKYYDAHKFVQRGYWNFLGPKTVSVFENILFAK